MDLQNFLYFYNITMYATTFKKYYNTLILICIGVFFLILIIFNKISWISLEKSQEGLTSAPIDGVIYSNDNNANGQDSFATIKKVSDTTMKSVTIPKQVTLGQNLYNVTTVGVNSFINLPNLETIIFPETITYIQTEALKNLPKLKSIVFLSKTTLPKLDNKWIYNINNSNSYANLGGITLSYSKTLQYTVDDLAGLSGYTPRAVTYEELLPALAPAPAPTPAPTGSSSYIVMFPLTNSNLKFSMTE